MTKRLKLYSLSMRDASGKHRSYFVCQCACGNVGKVRTQDVVSGKSERCRVCANRASSKIRSASCRESSKTHGLSRPRDPTYTTWALMWQRCTNPRADNFRWYGARGIRVCSRWKKFENFLADMGRRPDGMTIDRKDTDGNYEPDNCRWATPLEQASNKRKNNAVGKPGGPTGGPTDYVNIGLRARY
jgi:hypothetical protein